MAEPGRLEMRSNPPGKALEHPFFRSRVAGGAARQYSGSFRAGWLDGRSITSIAALLVILTGLNQPIRHRHIRIPPIALPTGSQVKPRHVQLGVAFAQRATESH